MKLLKNLDEIVIHSIVAVVVPWSFWVSKSVVDLQREYAVNLSRQDKKNIGAPGKASFESFPEFLKRVFTRE